MQAKSLADRRAERQRRQLDPAFQAKHKAFIADAERLAAMRAPVKLRITGAKLRLREVEVVTGLKKSAIYALIAAGKFPRPVRLFGKRISAWKAEEVMASLDRAEAA